MKRFFQLLATATVASAAFSVASPAYAKQCIWNKGGYVMSVSWFHPTALAPIQRPPHDRHWEILRNIAPPVRRQDLAVGTGSCNDTNDELVAIISVAGCMDRQSSDGKKTRCDRSRVPVYTHVKTSDSAERPGKAVPIKCRDRGHGYCWANSLDMTPPLPDMVPFMVITPPTTHYLDFWGTIFDVQWGSGGLIQ